MGRKRDPLGRRSRYYCPVFGKPISFQTGTNREPVKSAKYAKWRDNVIQQVRREIDDQSEGRGFEMILEPVCVRLIWYSPNVDDLADPDLDNMAKPYLDAIKGVIILEDRNVRLLRTIKVDINSELQEVPGVLDAKNSRELDVTHEFVMIIVEPMEDEHLASFSQDLTDD
jgi:Holliday junction resolvase RusA-like endonuclease